MTEHERLDAIQGLRDMADFFDANPRIPPPRWQTLNVPCESREDLAELARMTSWTKTYSEYYFALQKKFGGNLTLDVYVPREQVCRKVVTGTKVIPAVEAQPEREVEVTEWVCEDVALLEDARRI